MLDWLATTLRQNVEIPLFLALFIGYALGRVEIAKISLGDVTATLLAALVIGQIGITVSTTSRLCFSYSISLPSATAPGRNLYAGFFQADCSRRLSPRSSAF